MKMFKIFRQCRVTYFHIFFEISIKKELKRKKNKNNSFEERIFFLFQLICKIF